jgi:hypothetical protein
MEKRLFKANGTRKQGGIPILLYDKADFKPKLVRREEKLISC